MTTCGVLLAALHRLARTGIGIAIEMRIALSFLVPLLAPLAGHTHETTNSPLASAMLEERLGAELPLWLPLRDSHGREARLEDWLGREPVLLVLGYYHCPMLCSMIYDGLARSLREIEHSGSRAIRPYRVVSLSIDPRDDPESARERQRPVLEQLGWKPERWRFLTGTTANVRAIAERIGFGYRQDPASGEFAHPAVITVLAPGGRVSSYLYGIQPEPAEIAAAVERARNGQTHSAIDRVLLRCFRYVPALRRYGDSISLLLRIGGVLIGGGLSLLLARLIRIDRSRRNLR